MITDFNQLDLSKSYTYADYLTWQFEDRVELIKGKIFKMSPAPSRKHQECSGNLFGLLWAEMKGSDCKLFASTFDVRLPKKSTSKEKEVYTVVQPDLCIICDQAKLDDKGCTGAPDLVVEILSPHTSKKDLRDKYSLYEEYGVKTYWVIYPGEKTMEVYQLDEEGHYQFEKVYVEGDIVGIDFLKVSVDLGEVFA